MNKKEIAAKITAREDAERTDPRVVEVETGRVILSPEHPDRSTRVKATCQWGNGPDVALDLFYADGTAYSYELKASSARALAAQLIRAAELTERMDAEYMCWVENDRATAKTPTEDEIVQENISTMADGDPGMEDFLESMIDWDNGG